MARLVGFLRRLLPPQDQVHRPAAADVRPRPAQVPEEVGAGATGVFQGVGQHGETGWIEGAGG